jgi:hypothetical protein
VVVVQSTPELNVIEDGVACADELEPHNGELQIHMDSAFGLCSDLCMSSPLPPEQEYRPAPPTPVRRSNWMAVAALVIGVLAVPAVLRSFITPTHFGADLGYELGYRSVPALLSCTAVALGVAGVIRARSAGRGQGPAITGLVLGGSAAALAVLDLVGVIVGFSSVH